MIKADTGSKNGKVTEEKDEYRKMEGNIAAARDRRKAVDAGKELEGEKA